MKNAMTGKKYDFALGLLAIAMIVVGVMALIEINLRVPEVAVGYDGKPKYLIENGVKKRITNPNQMPGRYNSFTVPS